MKGTVGYMVNVIVITHGQLAEALIEAAEMIAGPQQQLVALPLQPGDSPEVLQGKLEAALQASEGQETLVLIDLLGGTPFNVVARCMLGRKNLEGVTGVNLPMLLEVALARQGASARELAGMITRAGQDSVKDLRRMLRKPSAIGDQRSA